MGRPPKDPADRYRTPVRHVRVPDAIWEAAQREADARGETVSDAVRRFLARYGKDHKE